MLGMNSIYPDSNSSIFVATPDSPMPSLGDYLWDLTIEIEEGEHITGFIWRGPKNYAYNALVNSTAS